MTEKTPRLTAEQLDEIRADLAAIPAPPWRWIGMRGAGGPLLVTDHSGQLYLLGPAHPVDEHGDQETDVEGRPVYGDLEFRDQRDGERWAVMRRAAEMIVPRAAYDPDAYADVDNPIARWIQRSAAHAAALLAEVEALRAQMAIVEEFLAERARFVTSINNCHPDNAHDYWRWQGHAEGRRHLSKRLGLPVAWPAGYLKAAAERRASTQREEADES